MPLLSCAFCMVAAGLAGAHAEPLATAGTDAGNASEAAAKGPPARSLHLVAALGGYASLGGPAGYGPMLAVDLLPGGAVGRYGLRGEWRGYRGESAGSGVVALLYEAGASRPQLALNLMAELGLSDDGKLIMGAGVETCLWMLGPLGISTVGDVRVIADGLDSRPALSLALAIHLGR